MRLTIGLLMLSIALLFSSESLAQEKTNLGGYLVPMCVYNGDTIPAFQIPTIHIFKPLKFRNRKEQMEYYKLVRNVKKVYPIARELFHSWSILLLQSFFHPFDMTLAGFFVGQGL